MNKFCLEKYETCHRVLAYTRVHAWLLALKEVSRSSLKVMVEEKENSLTGFHLNFIKLYTEMIKNLDI
jgi:hypothetical protein